ncbi:pyridoxal phosphate-dependent aminotransferase [Alkalihalobacillus oceani]|uniref:pyridoxal phosphate-dependent aminotransferase n=1 Tax=Halalkalibacter oceani TaxID=1653776 RepID=UPI00203CA192|nr:pyridoxal phosphate-dependent aminotransferase [Halalkalibacter oceani]MCM3760596.1 pyridoxal phosphate-dependent aminotransferase [Halalkalibacter oceani]
MKMEGSEGLKSFATSREQIPINSIREIMNIAENMEDVIELQIGEPSAHTPMYIREAAVKAMDEGFTHYTSNAGLVSVREAISRKMKREFDVNVPINRIIVTAGAVSALNISLLSLVESGEEVLIPDPGYPNYESLIRIQGSVPVFYPTKQENDFLPTVSDIESVITPATKAIIVNSPSNPTGAVFSEKKWKDILDLAKKHELYIISDEIYDGIIYEGSHISPLAVNPAMEDQIISIFGFSKVYAMTGWRLAYAIVPEKLFSLMGKLQEPITTCASSISQKAGEAALNGPQKFVDEMREVYRQSRDVACELLALYNFNYVKPKGAFYIPIDISTTKLNAKEFTLQLLHSEKVMVGSCDTFGPSGSNIIRICFAGDVEELKEGIKRMGQFYQKLINKHD